MHIFNLQKEIGQINKQIFTKLMTNIYSNFTMKTIIGNFTKNYFFFQKK